jgi:hypothetical protein
MEADGADGQRLSRRDRGILVLLLLGFLAFGGMVEFRSAFLTRRMGDLNVYLRSAWAVRTGASLYEVSDDNGWHYCYPPLLAILLQPLADAPAGTPRDGMLPYRALVAICYLLNLLCLFAAAHLLAGALEKLSSRPEVRAVTPSHRRWWLLRLAPVFMCLTPIGHTLMRGQMNLLLLLLVCGMLASLLKGQSLRAGLWLAGAICLKMFPAYLLVLPLWRRDLRCLAGCALGLVLGLVVIPVACLGPKLAWKYNEDLVRIMILPGLGLGEDQSRAKELIEVTATDSQSFLAVIHNTLHVDRATRPDVASPAVRQAHWLLGGALTLITLLLARRRAEGYRLAVVGGALMVLMVLLSPVCHTHYFVLTVPLMMGLLALSWERSGATQVGWGWQSAGFLYVLANTLPLLPALLLLRDTGLAMYATLLVWVAGCVALWRQTPAALSGSGQHEGELPRAA